ncbi:MAG TPA: peptidoglycan-associated lipoprotein Pal [Verrucomicrobiae bacterium]|nr:peptidoglycan-associated lipoprotein Pal [Verrucomicrobiae bacterium]
MRKNRTNTIAMLTALAMAAIVSGCHKQVASKPAVTKPPQQAAAAPAPAPASAPARTTTAEAARPAPGASLEQMFQLDVKDAFFDYNKSDIRPDAQKALSADAEFLRAHPSVRITIEGHCDERGSEEYNLGLGDRRASSAKRYLVDLGIEGSRIQTMSYGKERPFCTQDNESCWQENRRGHMAMER